MTCRTGSLALLLGVLFSRSALAGVSTAPAIAKAGGGQRALAVAFDEAGQLHAHVCAQEPCAVAGGTTIAVPADAASLATGARLRVARLGLSRKAIVVEIPDPGGARAWAAIVAAPLTGDAPLVAFSGHTGLVEGTDGERTGPALLVRDEGVYVGTEQEGRDLCGRPAILGARALDPATLTLRPAKVQRLTEKEMEGAPEVPAQRIEGAPLPALLHAVWATSAAEGSPPSALTDGKLETSWAENRGGAGRGEFAVVTAPRAVPLSGFELSLNPQQGAHAAVPETLWLATDHELYRVKLPEDAGRAPASRYAVTLPAPVKTGCVALVLDGSGKEDKDAVVGVAELSARPALGASTEELVYALTGGGPDAEAAGAVLRVSGPEAFVAVAAAFPGLDEGGRRAALDVLDDAPCDVALPVYIDALVGSSEAHRMHARSALSRCAATAAPAFVAALLKAPVKTRGALADELAGISPASAVQALVPLFAKAGVAERRAYRGALAQAARSSESRAALGAALSDASLPPVTTIDVLRALGEELPAYGDLARQAFARLGSAAAPFRTRYLLLGPAAALSQSDPGASAFLKSALAKDPDEHVRAEAARVLRAPKPFYAELVQSLDDGAVRVREAAVLALGAGGVEEARDRVIVRLKKDDWPLVRSAAARSLAGFAPGKPADEALGEALGDDSREVRRAALWGIGVRRALSEAPLVRERLTDREELPGVRATAAVTLGLVCDTGAADLLTARTLALVSPGADEGERMIGKSALVGLGLLQPADLPRRLAPLLDKKMPGVVRGLAQAALSKKGRCAPEVAVGRGAPR